MLKEMTVTAPIQRYKGLGGWIPSSFGKRP